MNDPALVESIIVQAQQQADHLESLGDDKSLRQAHELRQMVVKLSQPPFKEFHCRSERTATGRTSIKNEPFE